MKAPAEVPTVPCAACCGKGRQVLTGVQSRVWQALGTVPQTTNEIAAAVDLDGPSAIYHLGKLEALGLAARAGRIERAQLWVRAPHVEVPAAPEGARP